MDESAGRPGGSGARRPRALVVEDEYLVAMLIEDMLDAIGFEVAEIAQTLEAASSAAERGDFDVAVLDVNLAGEFINPVAEILERRGIPFVFATGYGRAGPHDTFMEAPSLQKPFGEDELRGALLAVMRAA
jgi:DNA-binding response OmpR family regulator